MIFYFLLIAILVISFIVGVIFIFREKKKHQDSLTDDVQQIFDFEPNTSSNVANSDSNADEDIEII